MKVPATIFSGFLGSGKTTIISHLIDKLQARGEQVVYIKNEIGDEDIDSEFIKGKNIQTKELLNGCICCTLVGPFSSAVDEIIENLNPDRILIEASGAADPVALALMISSQPKLNRDGVIGIIDVVNFHGYDDLSITAKNQTKFIDLLVFNKIELADLERKKAVVGYIRELNSHSPIIEAPEGKVEPELIFGINTKEMNNLLSDHHDHDLHDHIAQDKIESFAILTDKKIDQSKLEQAMTDLPPAIFRVKGIILSSDNQALLINKVGSRQDFQTLADSQKPQSSRIIFIGYQINQFEKETREKFNHVLES